MSNYAAQSLPVLSIEDGIANALKAAQALEPSISESLLALLKLAASEAARLRNAGKKASAKKAPKAAAKPRAKQAPKVEAKPARASNGRAKKALAVNGAAH